MLKIKDIIKKFLSYVFFIPPSLRIKILFLFSLFLVLFLNLYFRWFPFEFPHLKVRAKRIILERIYQGLNYEISQRFPQFNPVARQRLIKQAFSDYQRVNKKNIEEQIHKLYLQLKDRYQDENKRTYLFELDCWHWARYVENVLKHGFPGDQILYNEQRDLYMTAPLGFTMLWDRFLFYFSAFLYRIFSLFKPVELFRFLFGLPLFFMAIFITVLFFFCFPFSRYIGAITSCLFIGLAPIFVPRSCAGWFDKDILNLLFPLLVVWCYLLAITSTNLIKKVLWILFSSLWVGLFCFNWTHWWFVFFIVIIYGGVSVFVYLIRYIYKKESFSIFRDHLFSLVLFIIFSILWIIIFCSVKPLVKLLDQLKLAVILNIPLMGSIWPNVYATVGELRPASLIEIAKLSGGEIVFFIAVLSLCALVIRSFLENSYQGFKGQLVLMMLIWFFAMFFASMRGVRFVVFLLIPLGISLGWMFNEAYSHFVNKKQSWWLFIWVCIGVFVLNFYFVQQGYKVAQTLYPLMDDMWYKVLTLIKEKTPQNTIVNSWWDFGDWFKVVSRRRVIFDGQSQDTPQAYWMAKVLLSDNEEEALAILRMLNNAGNKAYEIINDCLKDPLRSVLILETALRSDAQKAETILQEHLPFFVVKEVMNILFKTPTNACFVVDYTMLSKIPAISYLGNWDFPKIYIAQNINKLERQVIIDYLKKLGHHPEKMQIFYQEAFLIKPKSLDDWLSEKYYFYGNIEEGLLKDGKVYFNNGFIYDPKENTLTSQTGQIPRSFFVLKEERFEEYIPNSPVNLRFSVFIMPYKENRYLSFLADRQLANSLFVRLYFLNAKGMKHFVPLISAEEGVNYIRVFNIAW